MKMSDPGTIPEKIMKSGGDAGKGRIQDTDLDDKRVCPSVTSESATNDKRETKNLITRRK